MQRAILPRSSGFVDTYPATIHWGGTCFLRCHARILWAQLLIANWIVSYFLSVIPNTDFEILETISWKYNISNISISYKDIFLYNNLIFIIVFATYSVHDGLFQ